MANIERTIIEGIKHEEMDFPKLFAEYENREYGILYYMEDNKDSYDGNHACIYPEKIIDFDAVINEITEFYDNKGIVASIYHPYVKSYFKNNEAVLKKYGYTNVEKPDHIVMILTAENQISDIKRLKICVKTEWDDVIAKDILIPSGEPWEIAATKKRLTNPNTYLFIGYLNNRAVVYTDIHVSNHGNTRFDYIVTAKTERGKGYASELLSFVVEYCKKNKLPTCWQWAGPSESICYKAGFREVFTMEAGYAVKK